LWRFSEGLQLTASEHQIIDQQLEALAGTGESANQDDAGNFPEATVDPLAAAVGNLIHQALETAMRDSARRLPELSAYWRRVLQRFSLSDRQMDEQLDFIARSVTTCLESDEHRWLFSGEHQDDQQELAVLSHLNGRAREFIIDRTLVDESGRRWIIDYKTAKPAPEQSISEFVAEQEELYRGQLAHYRSLFAKMEETEIVTALFFTALPLLHEVAIA
jgi:ATP-dependent exoDNAse (exonuclease V) beta subunit